MRHSGDIDARAKEIDDLVGNGEYEQFIKRLIDLIRDFGRQDEIDEGLLISGEFNRLERDERAGILEPADYRRSRLQVLKRGLQLRSYVINKSAMAA